MSAVAIGQVAQVTLVNGVAMRARWDGLRWWASLPCGGELPVEPSFVESVSTDAQDQQPSLLERVLRAMGLCVCR